MQVDSQVSGIAHSIQLAVAPVFVLTAVASMLGVLTNRLARIVDRARYLEPTLTSADEAARALIHRDLGALSRRAQYVNWAISLCTLCALLVCSVIAVLFVGAFLSVDVSVPIVLLFIVAMAAFIAALVNFLREIYLATATLRIGPH
jgi:hypothetical protein